MQEHEQPVDASGTCDSRIAAEVAWEVCWVKRGWIGAVLYFSTVLLLRELGYHDVLLVSLTPPAAYLLSTFALPQIKEWWLNKYVKDQR